MEWRDVVGYEGLYQINSYGEIRSLKSMMKQKPSIDGYTRINLTKDKIHKKHPVHRLVAQSFIDNPLNKPFINHKNGLRSDNRIENLEWCTTSENLAHSFRVLKRKHNKPTPPKAIIGVINGCAFYFDSAKETEKFGFNKDNVGLCARGKLKTSGGASWMFA